MKELPKHKIEFFTVGHQYGGGPGPISSFSIGAITEFNNIKIAGLGKTIDESVRNLQDNIADYYYKNNIV